MKVIAVIQARMGSKRLPGKSLMPLSKYSLLETVIRTTKRNKFIDRVIVATTVLTQDDKIYEHCLRNKIECYRGDPEDVLSRFVEIALNLHNEDIIVRVTADNPCCNHEVTKRLFDYHLHSDSEYTCVDGLSHTVYEFLNVKALLRLGRIETISSTDKEHVTMFIRNNPNIFKISKINPQHLGIDRFLDQMMTIDTREDYLRMLKLNTVFDLDRPLDFKKLSEYCLINNFNNE